jgi:hypothetical protein
MMITGFDVRESGDFEEADYLCDSFFSRDENENENLRGVFCLKRGR